MENSFGGCSLVDSQKNGVSVECFEKLELAHDVLDVRYSSTSDFKLDVFGSHLCKDSPVILYLGSYGDQLWEGLKLTGSRLVFLPLSSSVNSHIELYKLACKTASYILDHVTTGSLYIVGHGIGALLAAKLMADKELLLEKSRIGRLRGVFLISGIYKSITDDVNYENEMLYKEINDSWLSSYNFQLSFSDMDQISPLKDNFEHLWDLGTRCYVFTVEDDDPLLKLQSRHMFNLLAESCDQDNMHYEVKEKLSRNDIFIEMCKPNNFLTRLIRYDIKISNSR